MSRLFGCAVLAFGAVACAAGQTHRVKMGEMQTVLGEMTGLAGDPLESEPVEYVTVGKPKYDEFFRSAAEMRAGIVVSRTLSESLTSNVKQFARSYAAAHAADENVKSLVPGDRPEDMTEDQSIALLTLKKKQGELSDEEKRFALSAVSNAAQTTIYLSHSVDRSRALLDQGAELGRSVGADFQGSEATQAPSVVKSIEGAIDNVKQSSAEAPALAKTLARLGEGLKSLL